MSSVLWIYDKTGKAIAQIDASITRAWKLNEIGLAEWNMALLDPKMVLECIQFGNLVYITHETLPDWCGVIDTPRTWGRGTVKVTAYSAEKLLSYRTGTAEQKISGTAGTIFRKILAIANQQGDTLIREGDIFTGGTSREEKIDLLRLADEIKRVSERAKNDWDVTPDIQADGRLRFKANWYAAQGRVIDFALAEGANLEAGEDPLVEQGDIINQLIGISDGASSGSRITYKATDDTSNGTYGLRQGSKTFDGVKTQGTLKTNTDKELNVSKNPRKTFVVSALDQGDTYKHLRLGNTLRLQLPSVGFGIFTQVRILALSFSDDTGRVSLVVDEVIA